MVIKKSIGWTILANSSQINTVARYAGLTGIGTSASFAFCVTTY